MIVKNVSLKELTTFKIGGEAKAMLYPQSIEELSGAITKESISLVLGGGSNLLVSDNGVDGVTLNLGRAFCEMDIQKMKDGEIKVTAGAGANLTKLSSKLMKQSAKGFEFAFGIPGTLGGALKMNAGARDGEMKDVVSSVTAVTKDGEIVELNNSECGFSYRSSSFPKGSVLTGATLTLKEGDSAKIHKKMKQNYMARKESQPLNFPSAGSIFKNPDGDYAGRLIEEAGLKGKSVGGAKISEKHANFIVNTNNAKASDVLELMNAIEEKVDKIYNIRLEREVTLAGDF